MTDEEKEALRNFKSEYETCDHYSSDLIIELDDAEIILNLIEKQSKEIEELKMITKEYDSFLGNEKIIIADKSYFVKGYFKEKFISEDKIKAKMKEKEWSLENYDCNESDYKQSQAIGAWSVLQSLLKEE